MLSFTTHFWGERNNGFDVLYQNMKVGQVSSRELEEYLRESCSVEESYVKLQTKLAKMAANYGNRGSFGPFWQVLRVLSEKLSSIHQQLSLSWQDLIKEIHIYSVEQQKKHKEVKEKEGTTVEAVQAIQQTLISLHRAKETYHTKYYEYEKLKRDSSSQRDLEKGEAKLKKSNEDYRALLDKYTKSRNDFIDRMTESCQRFQEIEERHIQQMKEFLGVFYKARENHCSMVAQVQDQFKTSCSELTVQKLIEMIVQLKATGTEKPGTIEFIEADVSNLTSSVSMLDIDRRDISIATDGKYRNQITGILSIPKIKRHKKKREITDKEKDLKSDNTKSQHLVDEEGYSIRPDNVQNNRDSGDSSSDNDDSDVEGKSRIRVEIKPKADSPATGLEDIKNIVQTFKLQELPSRRTPVNEPKTTTHNSSDGTPTKPSDDLINLDLSSTQLLPQMPPQGIIQERSSVTPIAPSARLDSFPSTSSSSSLSSVLTGVATSLTNQDGDSPKNTRPSASVQPPLVPPPVPRSHSRNHPTLYAATSRPAGRQTPDVFRLLSSDRSESTFSLNSSVFSPPLHNSSTSFAGPPCHSMVGGCLSRGPSPLTLAMSDSVPVAVAFSEVVDAVFKGADPKNFRSRILGTMFVSFPGGIMRHFLENPNPSTLTFNIKNTKAIEELKVKAPLLTENESQGTEDSKSFSFDMPSVVEHLKKLTEQNRNAKYFNVDIIKYQVKTQAHTVDQLPLRVTSYWKSEPDQFDYRLDYSYQSSSMHPPSLPLSNVQVALQLPSSIAADARMQSLPAGDWSKETNRVTWKLSGISDVSENGSTGNVKAKFDSTSVKRSPPSTPPSSSTSSASSSGSSFNSCPQSNVAFLCEGATLSGLEFELASSGYRVSLVKKRFSTGTYLSHPEIIVMPTPEEATSGES